MKRKGRKEGKKRRKEKKKEKEERVRRKIERITKKKKTSKKASETGFDPGTFSVQRYGLISWAIYTPPATAVLVEVFIKTCACSSLIFA